MARQVVLAAVRVMFLGREEARGGESVGKVGVQGRERIHVPRAFGVWLGAAPYAVHSHRRNADRRGVPAPTSPGVTLVVMPSSHYG